jgi:hypothetical protein
MKSGLIVAMNIIECGTNLDLDFVVDMGKELHPIYHPEVKFVKNF